MGAVTIACYPVRSIAVINQRKHRGHEMAEISTYLETYIQVTLLGFGFGSIIELLMLGISKAVKLLDIQK